MTVLHLFVLIPFAGKINRREEAYGNRLRIYCLKTSQEKVSHPVMKLHGK